MPAADRGARALDGTSQPAVAAGRLPVVASTADTSPGSARLSLPKGGVLILMLLASAAVGYGDAITEELRLTALYLAVIFMAGWMGGRWIGCLVAVVDMGWVLWANPPPHIGSRHLSHYVLEGVGTMIVFVAAAILADRLRRSLDRERQQNLNLSRYLPAELAKLLAREGLKAARGRRTNAAILFMDMRDFTAASQPMEPDAIFAFLQTYRTLISRAVEEEGGIIDKFIGDGVLAMFGTVTSSPASAAAAIRCSHRVLKSIASWNTERTAKGEAPVRVGIGVHYGQILIGAIGDETRLEYSIVGHPVNVCSRIERLTKKYGVQLLVSEEALSAAALGGMTFEGWHHIVEEEVPGVSGTLQLASPDACTTARAA